MRFGIRAAAALIATVGTNSFASAFTSGTSCVRPTTSHLAMSTLPSWSDLQSSASSTPVGAALDNEVALRATGRAAPFVQNKLRLFDSEEFSAEKPPKITLYRDHAGWCPYCQKTMLLIEEKGIPIKIELVPMRSYGDKPTSFTRMVPSGLLPALIVETDDGRKQVITESQVIMELLDQWHSPSDGYKPMLPDSNDQAGNARYDMLARLERDLFSWWCTLIFRPEGPRLGGGGGGGGGLMGMLSGKGGGGNEMSGAMKGFLGCLDKVNAELTSTKGPWFFDTADHPTMIDFVYVSHVERMLASAAFWKGLDLRSVEMKKRFPGLNAWLEAFEKRECYLAFKSDYFTHVMDIPPQYGPGYDGGFDDKREQFSKSITGRDGSSWSLPLPFDDELQPLYTGPPLPLSVLDAAGMAGDNGKKEDSYQNANPAVMAKACRGMAGWKLASNGEAVARFAARGGPKGANNPRKTFGAQLADPYAESDKDVQPYADAALRAVCKSLIADDYDKALEDMKADLKAAVPSDQAGNVAASLAYLRDRVGVPRDLPLASARHLRAHINYAIQSIV